MIVADEKSQQAYSASTFKNKMGVAGMESFLSRPEFGVDIATEFPPRATKGAPSNKPISRADAMAIKCHELHQILLDAHKIAMAEDASRGAAAKQVFDGHRPDLPDAMAPDSHQTMLARVDLQTIRERARTQINSAYDRNCCLQMS